MQRKTMKLGQILSNGVIRIYINTDHKNGQQLFLLCRQEVKMDDTVTWGQSQNFQYESSE